MTPFEQLRLCPPWVCRVMAIEPGVRPYHHTSFGVRPVLLDALVNRSGIPRRTFQNMCWQDEWPHLDRIENYCRGCGVDPFDTERIAAFMLEHGDHLFKLVPHTFSRRKLRELDKRLANMMEGKGA